MFRYVNEVVFVNYFNLFDVCVCVGRVGWLAHRGLGGIRVDELRANR